MYSLVELTPILLGVIAFGLLHGVNPSHGWTVAVLYSIRSKRPLSSSIASSGIIAGAHFLSSIAVVLAFIFVTMLVQIPHTYMNYAVAIALGVLAFKVYMHIQDRVISYTKYLPKISALVLAAMAVSFAFGLL